MLQMEFKKQINTIQNHRRASTIESVYDFAKILIGKSMVRGYEENAHLVEQVHGEADNGESDDIGGGGDDGGDDQNHYNGVTTILLHVVPMEDA